MSIESESNISTSEVISPVNYDLRGKHLLFDIDPHSDIPVEEIRNVIYGQSDDGRPLRLNILRPVERNVEPRPVIVWIHGGGWGWKGNEDSYSRGTYSNYPFALKGYFTVSIEYTLTVRATFPAQIHDCKAAIRWLRAHAEEYHIDPERIGVWGRSAGGHLCNLLGTSTRAAELEGNGGWPDQPSHVNAVLNYFGPTDLNTIAGPQNGEKEDHIRMLLTKFLGGPIEEKRDIASAANPIRYISPQAPPFLSIHGAQDLPVPISQGEALHKALIQNGSTSTLIKVDHAGHGLLPADPDAEINPSLPELYKIIDTFFKKHLGL